MAEIPFPATDFLPKKSSWASYLPSVFHTQEPNQEPKDPSQAPKEDYQSYFKKF